MTLGGDRVGLDESATGTWPKAGALAPVFLPLCPYVQVLQGFQILGCETQGVALLGVCVWWPT